METDFIMEVLQFQMETELCLHFDCVNQRAEKRGKFGWDGAESLGGMELRKEGNLRGKSCDIFEGFDQ